METFGNIEMVKLRDLARSLNLPFRNDQELLILLETNDHFADHACNVLQPQKLFGQDPAPEPEPEPEPKKIAGMRPAVFGLIVVAVIVIAVLALVIIKKKK